MHWQALGRFDDGQISQMQYGINASTGGVFTSTRSCRIPDDYIDSKRYPLFMAREVMRQLIDNLCVTSAVHPGALS